MARIAEIQRLLTPAVGAAVAASPARATAFRASAKSDSADFAAALRQATAAADMGSNGKGGGIVAIAQREVGQAESPPGSNNSTRIAQYRSAVPGGPVGPWCAYFVSWVAAQDGTPLGDSGKGFGRVDDVWAWAQRNNRAVPVSGSGRPQPGDLIIWDEHMGVVESVGSDGSIKTIEGNSSDQVSRRVHGPDGDGAIGYVRMA